MSLVQCTRRGRRGLRKFVAAHAAYALDEWRVYFNIGKNAAKNSWGFSI